MNWFAQEARDRVATEGHPYKKATITRVSTKELQGRPSVAARSSTLCKTLTNMDLVHVYL